MRLNVTLYVHCLSGFCFYVCVVYRPLKKMGLIGCPKTSVRNYHYSLRNKPGERSSHLLRGGRLKSRTLIVFVSYGALFAIRLPCLLRCKTYR
jgi:hypothetical protein